MRKHTLRRRVATMLLLSTVFGMAATACGGTGQDPASGENAAANTGECGKPTRSLKHDLDTTKITGTPAKVVALEYSFVDALVAIGIKPVGIADDDDPKKLIPPLAEKVTGYTPLGLRQSPNLPAISALKPDLILADTARHKTIYQQLSKIAPTLAIASKEASYQQNLDSQLVIAQALDRCEEMQSRLDEHAAAIKALKAKVPADEKRTFLFAVAADKSFTVHSAAGFTPGVLTAIGETSAVPANPEQSQADMSLETLAGANPDVIFVAKSGPTTVLDTWEKSPVYQGLTAVKQGQVYEVDNNLWSRSRGLIAAELIGAEAIELLYP